RRFLVYRTLRRAVRRLAGLLLFGRFHLELAFADWRRRRIDLGQQLDELIVRDRPDVADSADVIGRRIDGERTLEGVVARESGRRARSSPRFKHVLLLQQGRRRNARVQDETAGRRANSPGLE